MLQLKRIIVLMILLRGENDLGMSTLSMREETKGEIQ